MTLALAALLLVPAAAAIAILADLAHALRAHRKENP